MSRIYQRSLFLPVWEVCCVFFLKYFTNFFSSSYTLLAFAPKYASQNNGQSAASVTHSIFLTEKSDKQWSMCVNNKRIAALMEYVGGGGG